MRVVVERERKEERGGEEDAGEEVGTAYYGFDAFG